MQHTDQAVSTHPERFQCRHIFTGGHRCGSPALRKEQFCFFHHTTRVPIRNPRERASRRATFELPLVEDRSSIQLAIAQILCRIAANELDPRRAGLLLYGLQIASLNLGKSPAGSLSHPDQTVEEVIQDPDLGPLAPVAQFQTAKHGKTLEQILMEEWAKEKQLQKIDQAAQLQPTTLPDLEAAGSPLCLSSRSQSKVTREGPASSPLFLKSRAAFRAKPGERERRLLVLIRRNAASRTVSPQTNLALTRSSRARRCGTLDRGTGSIRCKNSERGQPEPSPSQILTVRSCTPNLDDPVLPGLVADAPSLLHLALSRRSRGIRRWGTTAAERQTPASPLGP